MVVLNSICSPPYLISQKSVTLCSLFTYGGYIVTGLQNIVCKTLRASLEKIITLLRRVLFRPNFTLHIFKMPRALTLDCAQRKMWKNSKKAIREHRTADAISYMPAREGLPKYKKLFKNRSLKKLHYSYSSQEAQGVRATMEDAHFYRKIKQGVITGVFDGHGGSLLSKHVSQEFQNRFSKMLDNVEGNVHQAFERVFHEIQEGIVLDQTLSSMGSTAVISFIDKKTYLIYTATLGDSEANIYRRNQDAFLKSIPLSCIRDWSSEKDARRAAVVLCNPQIAAEWPNSNKSSKLRLRIEHRSINVSRSFGDLKYTNDPKKPAVIHKPKITVNRVMSGDILILSCDGLKDYVPERKIIKRISKYYNANNLAHKIVKYALHNKKSRDNVTVVALKIG